MFRWVTSGNDFKKLLQYQNNRSLSLLMAESGPNRGKRSLDQQGEEHAGKDSGRQEGGPPPVVKPVPPTQSWLGSLGSFGGMFKRSYSNQPAVDKDYWLKMTVEEKRRHYKCGKDFVTLHKIPTWPEFYETRVKSPVNIPHKYPVNKDVNSKVSIFSGDITTLEIDAIVNAANSSLLGGGGVDGAIHRAAGRSLVAECEELNGCDTGHTKITTGHRLPAKYILHTVGPFNGDASKLKSCYNTCFDLVKEHKLRSVAFCCIATGVYGFPNEGAANIALDITRKWLETDDNYAKVDRIVFVVFLKIDFKLYSKLMQAYFPLSEKDPTPTRDNTTPPCDVTTETSEGKTKIESETFKPSLEKSVTAPPTAAGTEKSKVETKMETEDDKIAADTHDDSHGGTTDSNNNVEERTENEKREYAVNILNIPEEREKNDDKMDTSEPNNGDETENDSHGNENHGDEANHENENNHGDEANHENENNHGDVANHENENNHGDEANHENENDHGDEANHENENNHGDETSNRKENEASHENETSHGNETSCDNNTNKPNDKNANNG